MSTNGNATIAFRVADNGIGSFMDNIKRKSDQMTNDIIRGAQAQTSSTKEQTKIIQEQIRLLERKTAIERAATVEQAKISRENRLNRIDEYQYNRVSDIQAQMRSKQITAKAGRQQIEQVQSRAGEMRERIEGNYSDKVTAVNASGREATLTNQLLRQNIDAAKNNSREQLNQMRKGDESIVNAVDDTALPVERFANQRASQQFEEEKSEKKEDDNKTKKQFLDFAKTIAIDRSLGMMSQIPSTRNELDFIKPSTSLLGTAAGGALTLGSSFGTLLGQRVGEFLGTAIERSWRSRDELTTQNFRVQALTGKNLDIEKPGTGDARGNRGLTAAQRANYNVAGKEPQGFERYGLSFEQEAELMYQVAQRQGTSRNMRGNAENMVAAEQGIGVTRETSLSLMELQRTSAENDRDFLRTLGGILQEGQKQVFANDRTFLNEFVTRNFAGLQRELLKTNNRVATGTTMDILQRFDSVGGQWSARDPRSLGLIGQVNSALSNPGSDNMKALSFSVMQQLHPEAGFYELQKRIQHGLNEPGYASGVKSALDNISGGNTDFAKMNFANAFGLRGNLDAAEDFYNRPDILNSKFSRKNLAGTGEYGEGAIRQQGQDQTSYYSQSAAQIQNKFVGDVVQAVEFVSDKMKVLFGDMTVMLKDYIKGELFGTSGKSTPRPPTNAIFTGKPDQIKSPSGYNVADPQGRRSAMEAGDYGSKE